MEGENYTTNSTTCIKLSEPTFLTISVGGGRLSIPLNTGKFDVELVDCNMTDAAAAFVEAIKQYAGSGK